MKHEEWCAQLCGHESCGKCTCPASRVGLWTTRTTSSGKFEDAKRSGDVFRGARREDGSWRLGDGVGPFDSLHFHLAISLAAATTGLILHAFGVFCG